MKKKLCSLPAVTAYINRRLINIFLLNFSCGLSLYLVGSTFAQWLGERGLNYTSIGLLAFATLPHSLKFLWAPLVDRLSLPYLTQWFGRRRSWLLLSQLIFMASLFMLSQIDPTQDLFVTSLLVLLISSSSATQDIVVLAYQVESLTQRQYGPAEAMGIFGYRMGMLFSGAGALYMCHSLGWNLTYLVMSLAVLVGILTNLFMEEPPVVFSKENRLLEEKAHQYLKSHPGLTSFQAQVLGWLYGAVVCPFLDFMRRKEWIAALFLLFFYKLGDHLISHLKNLFYTDLGFTTLQIANASKIFGMVCLILGGFIGGTLVVRMGFIRSLLFCAIVHGLANIMYLVLFYAGDNISVLYLAIALENITAGMRLTALFSFEMLLCNPSYAATQMALFTSLVALSRTVVSAFSGALVDALGWEHFLYLMILAPLPSLGIIVWLQKHMRKVS